MLLYNKVNDPYHTLFRMLNILYLVEDSSIELERLRIYDFLLAFPSYIVECRLPRHLTSRKKDFKRYRNIYNAFNPRVSFVRMKPIQDGVILHLEKMFILKKMKNQNKFELNKQKIPIELVTDFKSIDSELLKLVCNDFSEISLFGKNGLKARLNIMEFKYDSI